MIKVQAPKNSLLCTATIWLSALPTFAGERDRDAVGVARVSDQPSPALLDSLKRLEGLKLNAYRCTGGVYTYGYGHTEGVTKGMQLKDEAEATALLVNDVTPHRNRVLKLFSAHNLAENEVDALTCFRFNLGRFKQSFVDFLNKRIPLLHDADEREQALKEIAVKFCEYRNSGGKYTRGLLRRRLCEVLMLAGDPDPIIQDKEFKRLEIDARASFGNEPVKISKLVERIIDRLFIERGITKIK